MVFPNTPLDMVTEIWTGDWTPIRSDVYNRDKVTIRGGAPNEGGRVETTRLTMTINNRGGTYTPRNPTSALYGTIGRYTPLRHSVRTVVESFTRTLSNAWGDTDTGQTWSLFWVSGSGNDFDVAGGVGTMVVDGTSEYRAAWLGADESYLDVEVAATVTAITGTSLPNVTGGNLEPCNLLMRMQSVNVYYMARVYIDTAEAVHLQLMHEDTGVTTALASLTMSDLTYNGQALRVRAHVEGQVLRAKVWDPSGPEPFGWQLVVADDRITSPGGIGVRNGVGSGNTNVPVTFSIEDLEARLPLAFVEVAKWPTRWNVAGTDRWTPITAQGIRRRLSQGKTPLRSALYRAITTESPVAHWPLEDGELSSTGSNVVDPTRPMRVFDGDVEFAGGSLGAAIQTAVHIPDDSEAWLTADIAPYGTETEWAVEYTIKLAGGPVAGQRIITAAASGLQFRVTCVDGNPTSLSYRVATASGETTTPIDTESIDLFDDEVHHIRVAAVQDGADIDWTWWIDGVQVGTGTIATQTLAHVSGWQTTLNVPGVEQTIGGVAVYATATAGDHYEAMLGYPGETAADRIERLCTEEGIPVAIVGDASSSAAMGAQTRQTFTALLDECEASDLGRIWEPFGAPGFVYRCRSSYYNQPSSLALSYGQLTPFVPVEDDQVIANDVTVTRIRGASARVVQETGRLSIQDPPEGIGVVDTEDRINVEDDLALAAQAGWRLHTRTWDEARYPTIRIHLASIGRASRALMYRAATRGPRDRFTISDPPEWLPPDVIDQVVEGWSMNLSLTDWELFVNCAPYGPYEVHQVAATGNRGRVDTGGCVLHAAVDDNDTPMVVTTWRGPGWRSTAGGAATPYDCAIGGEQVTVTAVGAMTAPAFINAGAVAHGNNASVVPGMPAGVLGGHLMLVLAAIRNSGTGAPVLPSGYRELVRSGNVGLFGRIAAGTFGQPTTDAAPTVTFTGGVANADTSAHMAAFSGMCPDLDLLVARNRITGQRSNASVVNASAQDIAYPALEVHQDRCVVLYLGWKQDDWTSVAAISGATEIGEPDTTTGDDQGTVWDYVIQTSRANIPAGSFVVTGGASAISRGLVVALVGGTQAFTVTRSVNGVAKAHAAGAPISLWRPGVYAL